MQTSFNGGELSPLMMGRADHDMWGISLKTMVGWLPRPQGPAEACPGTRFLGWCKGPCRLIRFEPDVLQSYVLELGDHYIRFWTNDVLLTEPGGDPVELVTPWSIEQVAELDYWPSIDVLYLVHRASPPRQLVRNGAASFALELLTLENGPFDDRNNDESRTIAFSGVVGSVEATASAPIFAASDVGRLIEIEATDLSSVPSWEPGITVTVGKLMQWGGRVYQVVGLGAGKRTGTVAPEHVDGIEWDGLGAGKDINDKDAAGVQLAYLHDLTGRLRIDAVISSTVVQATVTRRLPLTAATSYGVGDYGYSHFNPAPEPGYEPADPYEPPAGSGTTTPGGWRWRLGAFSDTTGWPERVTIWEQRLYLARDDRLWASMAASLTDFERVNLLGDIAPDTAFSGTLDDPNRIMWMMPGQELFIGTRTREYALRPASAARGIGPGNVRVPAIGKSGSAAVRPLDIDGRPAFVQRHGHKIITPVPVTVESYQPEDLTRYADHIGGPGIIEMQWQSEPLPLLWAVRGDGTLAVADWLPSEQVLGWARRPLADGLAARSIAAASSIDGRRDDLWIAAEIDGGWMMLQLGAIRAATDDGDAPMTDAALEYQGDPVTTISELDHLAGRLVDVRADDAWIGTFTVAADGTLVLPSPAAHIVVGLPFPALMETLPMEAGGDSGPAQFKMGRIARVGFRLHRAGGLQIDMKALPAPIPIEDQPEGTLADSVPPLITGDVLYDSIGGFDRTGALTIERIGPLPATVLAAMAIIEKAQR